MDTEPLHKAVIANDEAAVNEILNSGVDVDTLWRGSTSLHDAAGGGYAPMVRLLLAKGANPNALDEIERSPLQLALEYGLQNESPDGGLMTVHLLLEHGADPAAGDIDEPPLMLATLHESVQALAMLLEFGARVDQVNANGSTALVWAASGDVASVRLLIEHGANPNVRPKSGWTALRFAVNSANFDMVQLLLDAGADVTSLDNEGKSLLSLALEQTDEGIIQLLRSAGAR